MLNDFFNLIFPKLCCACNTALLKNEQTICLNCIITLPKTNFHLDEVNPVHKVFWGRVKIEMATAFYFFSQKSRVQHLLHHLKYKGTKEVGILVGQLMGYELKGADNYRGVDVVVPVPLHQNKLKKRGYNQSECIAIGLAETMGLPINANTLYRKEDSNTQTKKNRYKRWENVGEIFGLKNDLLTGENVLLIDDILL